MNKGDDAAETTAKTAAYAGAGLIGGAAIAGARGLQAGRLAALLTSTDPQVQQRVLRALTMSPALRRAAQHLVAQGAARGGVQAGQELQQ
jgi:hypothetical protein